MKIAAMKEIHEGEKRVPLIPPTVNNLVKVGADIEVEAGIGATCRYSDADYEQAGARVIADRKALLQSADMVLRLRKPPVREIHLMKKGCIHVSYLDPFNEAELLGKLQAGGISAVSLEMLPRSTIAQKMDVLSSQASLGGYVAVILAAGNLDKILPMMTTPSGVIKPCGAFIIGVGVAGLQAIATARRLGARVEAFDIRTVVEEQVKSLGARFVRIDLGETGQTRDGYARALAPEQLRMQKEGMAKVCAQSDIVITTAQIFGRMAPRIVNGLILPTAVCAGIAFSIDSASGYPIFLVIVAAALVFGVTSVIPIGGADMPVVISLLNSYSGIAVCAAGFVIHNNILIVAGALVGASGIILTQIMCRPMNRSLANVLFSGFGAKVQKAGEGSQDEVRPATAEDVYYILEAAGSVAFVPGYGLSVAQAQHVVRELGDLLEANGAEVMYAIHPVAGRMPGHMNVLLAEANVPYDQLVEMDDINSKMDAIDAAVVIGANDVVNPAALNDPGSPIYGMPIIEAHRARTVIVLKRSMSAGFAGIQNALFFGNNTRMYFGDAKASIQALVAELKRADS